jgi:hypothetical protein
MPRKIREEEVDTRVTCRLPAEFIPILNEWAAADWFSISLLVRNLVIAGARLRLEAEGREPIVPGDVNTCTILPKSRVGIGAPPARRAAAARELEDHAA